MALCIGLMLLNYADRQVVTALFPYIKADWALSDTELGLLSSAVPIVVALGALPLALLLGRGDPIRPIAAMGALWSLATLACAFAQSYPALLAGRALIGFGEAAYGALAGALLASMFPARWRATILGAFLSAASLGSIVGVAAGGAVAATHGWRIAFGALALPGLVLAAMVLSIRPDGRPASSDRGHADPALRGALRRLVSTRSAVAAYAAGALQLIVISALYAWLPSYFGRTYGWPGDRAAMATAAMLIVGTVGIVVWGHVADRLTGRFAAARLWLPAACAAASFLVLSPAFACVPTGTGQLALIALGSFLATATVGPLPAVATAVTPPWLHASALAMLAAVQNLFGLATGPLLSGAVSDAVGIRAALALVPLAALPAAAILLIGCRFYRNEAATGRPAAGAVS